VVGGLVVSQTLTLYVTPIFYIYMERLQEWLAHRGAARQPVTERDQPAVDRARSVAERAPAAGSER